MRSSPPIWNAARRNTANSCIGLDVHLDGEYVELTYHLRRVPFDRIRRITGYLVGTVDRFNNGKRAEERDRVKHGMGGSGCERLV